MDDLKATIEMADNGFVLKTKEYFDYVMEGGEKEFEKVRVFEDSNNCTEERHSEVENFCSLFWALCDYFGFYNNKHSNHNIEIKCSCVDENIKQDNVPIFNEVK